MMKLIKEISVDDVTMINPDLFLALESDKNDVFYCWDCDGLRLRNHPCRCHLKNDDDPSYGKILE